MKTRLTPEADKRPLLVERVISDRVYLKPKEKGGRVDKDRDGRDLFPWIRPASTEDARLILSWLSASSTGKETEFRWLGGKSGQGAESATAQIQSWIKSPYGSFVLFLATKRKESNELAIRLPVEQTPVAFMNIDDFPEGPADKGPNLEVGRLIVRPDFRWQGYGSTLLRHVTRVLGEMGISSSINARVLEDNRVALAMFGKLPFRKLEEIPHYEPNTADGCVFYRYQLAKKTSRLGQHIADLRRASDLTQAEAAFLCGIAPSMLNMIESNNRTPSFSTLQDITSVLANDQYQRVRLLLSILGELPDKSTENALKRAHDLDSDISPRSQRANYWIFSDLLLEDIDNTWFNGTVSAVRSEFDRWYFVPPGYWEIQGKILVRRLLAAGLSEPDANRHLRFYKAPAALCALRVAVRVPHLDSAVADTANASASIGGRWSDRFDVDPERSAALISSVLKIVRNLESLAGTGALEEIEGFRLVYPELTRTSTETLKA